MSLVEFEDLPNTTTPVNAANLNNNFRELFNLIYPVGSIYMSINNTDPGTLFGGTWVPWGTGRTPVGVDTSQTEFSTVEKTGGSKYIQDHRHEWANKNGRGFVGALGWSYAAPSSGSNFPACDDTSGTTGGILSSGTGSVPVGNSGNLPPYITCYMFKRTA